MREAKTRNVNRLRIYENLPSSFALLISDKQTIHSERLVGLPEELEEEDLVLNEQVWYTNLNQKYG